MGILIRALVLMSLLGCSQTPEPKDWLYQQLGAQPGIDQLTTGLLHKIAQDPQIVGHFQDTDIARFKRLLSEHLCQLSGGPCRYSGASMQEAHTGFQISQADFDQLVAHLMAVMNEQNIAVAAQNRLLALLAPMYKDVVYR